MLFRSPISGIRSKTVSDPCEEPGIIVPMGGTCQYWTCREDSVDLCIRTPVSDLSVMSKGPLTVKVPVKANTFQQSPMV